MKKKIKIVIGICIVVAITQLMMITTQAGEKYVIMDISGTMIQTEYSKNILKIEEGQKLELGDMFMYLNTTETSKNRYLCELKDVIYKSSNAEIATIRKTGLLKALKPGKTRITVGYEGQKMHFELIVVSSEEANTSQEIKKLRKNVEKFVAKIPAKVTNKNVSDYLEAYIDTLIQMTKYSEMFDLNGISKQAFEENQYLVIPQAISIDKVRRQLLAYAAVVQHPTIKSVKAIAGTNKIKLKLNSNLTKKQVLAQKIYNVILQEENHSFVEGVRAFGKTYADEYVIVKTRIMDGTNGTIGDAEARMKAGNDVLIFVMNDRINTKFVRNHSYRMSENESTDYYSICQYKKMFIAK